MGNQETRGTQRNQLTITSSILVIMSVVVAASLIVGVSGDQWQTTTHNHRRQRSPLAARRAADDSRPLMRVPAQHARAKPSLHAAESRSDSAAAAETIVTGRFKAPAPDQIRVPKSAQFGAHTLSASYRVSDSETPEKLVHGIAGASTTTTTTTRQQKNDSIRRTVGAKFQVSDEGLNYPPSKLSADIYGNVAEIVTAPPEAVESDFLLPNSRRFLGGSTRP